MRSIVHRLLSTLLVVAASASAFAQDESAPAKPVQLIDQAGEWDFCAGTTIELSSAVFHGADMHTRATIRWPQAKNSPPRKHDVDIASDFFGNRVPWLVAWQPGTAVLFTAQCRVSQTIGQVDEDLYIDSLQCIDLRDPNKIRTTHVYGLGPTDFVPDAIVKALETRAVLPPINNRKPQVSETSAQRNHTIDVLVRTRVVSHDGKPLAGVPVRFPVVIPPLPHSKRGTRLTAPTNSGVPVARAITGPDGFAVAALQLSDRANDRGAHILPTATARNVRLQPLPRMDITLEQLTHRVLGARDGVGDAELRGRIVDADGAPMRGVRVAAIPMPGDAGFALPLPTISDTEGRFTINELQRRKPLRVVAWRANGTAAFVAEAFVAKRKTQDLQFVWHEGDERTPPRIEPAK